MGLTKNYIISVAKNLTLKQNNNYMLAIVGDTGSSKSYTAISLALMIDKSFCLDRICFRAKDFLQLTNSGLEPGSVLMFDEAGVDVSSREWYTTKNRLIKDTVDVFRRDNLICIWTTPSMSGLDSQVRSKFDAVMLMVGRGKGQYRRVVTDHVEGKIYYPYPKVSGMTMEGASFRGDYYNVKIPYAVDVEKAVGKEGLIDAYEEVKRDFTEEVKAITLKELTSEDEEMEFDTYKLVGLLTHNMELYRINSTMADSKLYQYISSKLKVENPNWKFTGSELKEAITFVRQEGDKLIDKVPNPIEGTKFKDDGKPHYEYLPIMRKMMHSNNGNEPASIPEMAKKLSLDYHRVYYLHKRYGDILKEYNEPDFNEWYANLMK